MTATYSTDAEISKFINSSSTVRSKTLLVCYWHLMHIANLSTGWRWRIYTYAVPQQGMLTKTDNCCIL